MSKLTEEAALIAGHSVIVHELKVWPPYFEAIERGDKNFEARRDDRGFQRGDVLKLSFHEPAHPWKSRKPLFRRITYILTGGRFGVEAGHVVMALEPCEDPSAIREILLSEGGEA